MNRGTDAIEAVAGGLGGVQFVGAYALYGENYAETGTQDRSFTGQNQDIVSPGSYPLYDFLMREYHPTWGRWLSPDPAGLAAANPANPQSWNRYSYALNNPTTLTDPLGLCPTDLYQASAPCNDPAENGDIPLTPPGNFDASVSGNAPPPVSPYGSPEANWEASVPGGVAHEGDDIFDAVAGAPGTYLTYDQYGNLSWGFSVDLYNETENLIGSERGAFSTQGLNPSLVPTMGYQVTISYYGEVSGLIPDYERLAEMRMQLASTAGDLSGYEGRLTAYGATGLYGLFNQEAQSYALTNTLIFLAQFNPGLYGFMAPWMAPYQNFVNQFITYAYGFFTQNLPPD